MLRMSMTCGEPRSECDRVRPVRLERRRALEQPLALDRLERREPGRGRERMAGVRVAVEQLDAAPPAPLHDRVVDRRRARTPRPSAPRAFVMPFAIVIMSGVTPNFVGGERRAEPAEAGDDLVEDEQDAVLVADLAQRARGSPSAE